MQVEFILKGLIAAFGLCFPTFAQALPPPQGPISPPRAPLCFGPVTGESTRGRENFFALTNVYDGAARSREVHSGPHGETLILDHEVRTGEPRSFANFQFIDPVGPHMVTGRLGFENGKITHVQNYSSAQVFMGGKQDTSFVNTPIHSMKRFLEHIQRNGADLSQMQFHFKIWIEKSWVQISAADVLANVEKANDTEIEVIDRIIRKRNVPSEVEGYVEFILSTNLANGTYHHDLLKQSIEQIMDTELARGGNFDSYDKTKPFDSDLQWRLRRFIEVGNRVPAIRQSIIERMAKFTTLKQFSYFFDNHLIWYNEAEADLIAESISLNRVTPEGAVYLAPRLLMGSRAKQILSELLARITEPSANNYSPDGNKYSRELWEEATLIRGESYGHFSEVSAWTIARSSKNHNFVSRAVRLLNDNASGIRITSPILNETFKRLDLLFGHKALNAIHRAATEGPLTVRIINRISHGGNLQNVIDWSDIIRNIYFDRSLEPIDYPQSYWGYR